MLPIHARPSIYSKSTRPYLITCILLHCIIYLTATPVTLAHTTHNKLIQQYFNSQKTKRIINTSTRIHIASNLFLGKPYAYDGLGENGSSVLEQNPWFRTDQFDCMTYVSTVLALVKTNNPSNFIQTIKKIRYHKEPASFFNRNHFLSLDWNSANTKNHYIKDISSQITDQNNKPVYQIATANINKRNWLIKTYNKWKQTEKLSTLDHQNFQNEINQATTHINTTPYIPLTKLFTKNNSLNVYIKKQIPDGAIIEIVRPNWKIADKIGTNINMSHLGFAIYKQGQLFFRHAAENKFVLDIPLQDYLLPYYLNKHSSVKGIAILKVI